jgi:uncharacterized membrane-anchored protein YjiN (DUF445 family)
MSQREFTFHLERFEMIWLVRHLQMALKGSEGAIKTYSHLTEDQDAKAKVLNAQQTLDLLTPLYRWCEAEFTRVENERLKRVNRLEELYEAASLVEEDSAKEAVKVEIERVASAPPPKYPVKVDRTLIKFMVKMLEHDTESARIKILKEDKKETSQFPDSIMTKSYYVNKLKKEKDILQELLKELKRFL